MNDIQALVAECEELIRRIDLPDPFSMQGLCDRLGALRASTVFLCPVATRLGDSCGNLFTLDAHGHRFDVIAYERRAPFWHQAQVVLHEAGHALFNDQGTKPPPPPLVAQIRSLMPTIDYNIIRSTLGCSRGRAPRATTDSPAGLSAAPAPMARDDVTGAVQTRRWGAYDEHAERRAEYFGSRVLHQIYLRSGPLTDDAPQGLVALNAALANHRRSHTHGQ